MNNEYKPILICNGNEHDLKNHGELICGGCGYVFDSNEAEGLFKNVEFKPGYGGFGAVLYSSAPLCCVRCFQEFEKIYLSERHETFYINPSSVFKKRYITNYGELILPKEYSDAEFIPALDPAKRIKTTYIESLFIPNRDFDKQRRMSYDEAIAYMLYSSLYPLGYTSSDMALYVGSDYCEMYCVGAPVNPYLYEDITNISKESFRCHLGEFDRILEIMRDMESSIFFSIGGNEND